MAQLDLSGSLASPAGPFVVFVARSSRCHNGANIHGQKIWLRGTIPPVEDTFNETYGILGNRPYAYCPFVHGANDPMTSEHETIRYLTSFMNKAWAAECGAIFVLSGCAGLTTDTTTFINLFKDFKDVNVQIKVYASFEDRQYGHFWEVNPHKVCDIFEGKPIPENASMDDSEWFATNFRLQHGVKAKAEDYSQFDEFSKGLIGNGTAMGSKLWAARSMTTSLKRLNMGVSRTIRGDENDAT